MYDNKICGVGAQILTSREAVDNFSRATAEEKNTTTHEGNDFFAIAMRRDTIWSVLYNMVYEDLSVYDDRYYALSTEQKKDIACEYADRHTDEMILFFCNEVISAASTRAIPFSKFRDFKEKQKDDGK